MQLKKKILAAGLACALAIGTPGVMDNTAFAETVQPAAVQAVDARTQLTNALNNLAAEDNGTLSFKLNFNSPLLGGDMSGSCDFVSKPTFIAKGVGEIVFNVAGVPNGKTQYNFYSRETADNMEFYSQNIKGGWDKYVYRKADSKAVEESVQKGLQTDFPDVVKGVTLGQRQGADQDYVVVLDGQKVKDYVMKLYNLESVKKGSKESDRKLLEDVLTNMGDLQCTITIDEVQHHFRKLHADLTPQARAAAKAVLSNMKDSSGMEAIVDASTIEISFTGSNYGRIQKVDIPTEVVENAVVKELPKVPEKTNK